VVATPGGALPCWRYFFGALFLALAAPPWRPILAHPDQLPIFLLLGMLPTAVAYVLYIGGLRHLAAGTASLLASAEPVIAALLGATVLGESLGAEQVVGIGLIVGAGVLLTRRRTVEPSNVSATSRV